MEEGGLFLCVRIPKSGSQSLVSGLEAAFVGRRIFYVPNTLDPDSRVQRLQRLRFLRARFQNLHRHYHTPSLSAVWQHIDREAVAGDLLMGGHVDFRTARASLTGPLRIITLLREPITRARSEYDYMRRSFARKPALNRFDASVLHKAAGRMDFDSYLDFLFAHRAIYGDIACQYIGWDGTEDIAQFSDCNIFHCGVLERSGNFARGLSEKLGRTFALPIKNRTAGDRAEVTHAQRTRLERIHARDLALYEWVKANC